MDFILVSKICKEPPICKATWDARIFYVYGDDSMQRACIHLKYNRHPFKTIDYRFTCKKIDAFIDEHVERRPEAPLNKIVMEVSKDLFGEYLLDS